MALVRILNVGSNPQRIEFVNDSGGKDLTTVHGKSSTTIEESLLLTPKDELTRKRLKILRLDGSTVKEEAVTVAVVVEPVTPVEVVAVQASPEVTETKEDVIAGDEGEKSTEEEEKAVQEPEELKSQESQPTQEPPKAKPTTQPGQAQRPPQGNANQQSNKNR